MKNFPFNELLESPHLLAHIPIEELENLAKDYPWFSLAHSYLAKAYQENKSHKTSGQIALASTLHSNRSWLYGFLKEPIPQQRNHTEFTDTLPPEITQEIVLELPPTAVANSTSLSELAESMLEETVREDKREEEKVVQEVSEEKIEEEKAVQEVREDKSEEEEVSDLDFLDKSILATAISSSIFLEVSEREAEQDSSQGASQGLAEEPESNALFTWLRSVSDEEERKSAETVQPSTDLIEKFIATEPRITPGKVEQYTGVSFAKDSLEENFDWVTETMAKLYATQGKIDRARKAYKRLIELYPEKKIHFENQLKALNQRK